MTFSLPYKQVNAILVALDAEIEMQLGGRPVDWESFPEVAAMLMAYYTTRCKFEKEYEEDWCQACEDGTCSDLSPTEEDDCNG
jgi:hypothetical protein